MAYPVYDIYTWWLQQAMSIRIASVAFIGCCVTGILAFAAAEIGYYEFATIMMSLALISAGGMMSAGIVSFFTARNFWFRR